METINKPWGKEEILFVHDKYMVKKLYMNPNERCSLQYHAEKTETVYVLSGLLLFDLGGKITSMKPGEFCTIMPGQMHRMEGGPDGATYLESSTPELDDVIRVKDDYGRN